MSNHELSVESNIAYPGGKNGWSRAWCSCDPARLWWGSDDTSALKPAKIHKRDKDAQEAEAQ